MNYCSHPINSSRENLEGTNADKFEPKIGEFGYAYLLIIQLKQIIDRTLNGIDLKSLIDPYVMENCGPAFGKSFPYSLFILLYLQPVTISELIVQNTLHASILLPVHWPDVASRME